MCQASCPVIGSDSEGVKGMKCLPFYVTPRKKLKYSGTTGIVEMGILTPYIVVTLPRKPNEAFTI
jgi:hypothetical protein